MIDGDTIKIAGIKANIRLYGVDTPEKKQAGGREATIFVEKFLNKEVEITVVTKDRYGRIVAIVHDKETGESLQEMLLLAGHAWVYEQYAKKEYREPWKDLEFIAMREANGLWEMADITAPWDWRKEQKAKWKSKK